MHTDLRVVLVRLAVVALSVALATPGLAQGRVRGEVTDDYGNPIEGATVTAETRVSGRTFTMTTDEDGRFVAAGLAGGVWSFTAMAQGYVGIRTDAQISQLSNNAPIDFELPVASTGGRFRSETTFESDPAGTTITFAEDGKFTYEDADGEGEGTYGIVDISVVLVMRKWDGPEDKFTFREPVIAEFDNKNFDAFTFGSQRLLKK